MPIDQVQTAIEGFLATHWTQTDLAYENDGYLSRTDGNGSLIPFVLVEVQGALYEQRSIGAGTPVADLWMDRGVLWLHVLVGSNTGSQTAKTYAASLAELFRGLELDPAIAFGDITIAASGGVVDGNDWAISVSIDWQQG